MRWIAIVCALAGAACVSEGSVTFALALRVDRASTGISINGEQVDAGGAAPRTINVSYAFAGWADATRASYLLESFAGASKLGELTVAPAGCTTGSAETQVIDVHTDGTFSVADDRCM